eukprot:852775_1
MHFLFFLFYLLQPPSGRIMATQTTQHLTLTVNNCLTANETQPLRLKLKGDWPRILHKITTKIAKTWNVTKYSFSIEQDDTTVTIKNDDTQQFESIFSAMSSPITISIVPSINNDDDSKEEEELTHTLIFHYDNKQFEYKLDKDFDPTDDNLFENIVKAVQNRFQLNGNIKIIDLENYDVVAMDDIEDRIDDDETLDLKIQHVPNEHDDIKSKDNASCVIKRMRECTSDNVKEMIQFHHNIVTKISRNYRDDIVKAQIESKNLYHVLESLNTARPRVAQDYHTLDPLFQQNIAFWQQYARIRLIQWNVEQCIMKRVGIVTELFQTNAFKGYEPFQSKYSEILQIIDKYHQLHENAEKSAYDVLLASIADIQIEIQPHQRPIDPDRILDEVALDSATLQSTQNEAPRKKEDVYRIYFYLNQEFVTKVFVHCTSLSTGKDSNYIPMKRVKQNGKLYYTGLNIQWIQPQTSTKVKFYYKYRLYRGGAIRYGEKWGPDVDGERDLYKGSLGYYSISTTASWYYTDIQRNAGDAIIDHIIDHECETYESYQSSSEIITGTVFSTLLKESEPHIDALFKQVVSKSERAHQMPNVFKLQLLQTYIQSAQDLFYVMNVETVYHVIKTYVEDRKYRRQRMIIGQEIYDSFFRPVRDLFSDRKLSSKEYVLLHPIYNFFRYFQSRKKAKQRWNRKSLEFDKRKHAQLCASDPSWKQLSMRTVLEVDLNIASLDQCHRPCPLEHLVIKLCDIHRASNGVELFKEFLEAISLQKETKNIYDDIFAKPIYRVYLFSVLRTDFNLWRQLIASIGPDVIHMNQKIFNSFQTNLHHQIGRMDGKAAKLQQLNILIIKFPQLFDTPRTRCALLRNFKLIQCKKQKQKQLRITLTIIIAMTIRGKFMEDMDSWRVVYDDLIAWMTHILLTY